jgi:hypothetical protein
MTVTACYSDPYAQQRRTAKRNDSLGFLRTAEMDVICKHIFSLCFSSRNYYDYVYSLSHKPVIIVGAFDNQSSDVFDITALEARFEANIRQSGKADVFDAARAGNNRPSLPPEGSAFYYNVLEREAARILQTSEADCILTGQVGTVLGKINLKAARRFFVSVQLRDIKTKQVLWQGSYNEMIKQIKTGPMRKEALRNGATINRAR